MPATIQRWDVYKLSVNCLGFQSSFSCYVEVCLAVLTAWVSASKLLPFLTLYKDSWSYNYIKRRHRYRYRYARMIYFSFFLIWCFKKPELPITESRVIDIILGHYTNNKPIYFTASFSNDRGSIIYLTIPYCLAFKLFPVR